MKKRCYVCGNRRPRTLKTRIGYANAARRPIFCSVRCAADWGLLMAETAGEDDIQWCPKHGWYTGEMTYDGCPECPLKDRFA